MADETHHTGPNPRDPTAQDIREAEPWSMFGSKPRAPLPREILESKPWSILGSNMGSDQSLDQIKIWDSRCRKGHQFCYKHTSATFFPTRVIDVHDLANGKVSLRNGEDVRKDHVDEDATSPLSTDSSAN